MRYRSSHRKSFNFTYGLEYQNPVAEDPATEPVLPTTNDDDITIQVAASPNIYVNPHNLTEKEAPLATAKDSSSDQSMQSLVLKFGDSGSQESLPEKEELTAL